MRKYVQTAVLSFKAQIVWRFDTAMTMALCLFQILFAHILWGALFAGRQYIAGFTRESMMAYAVVSAFLTQLDLSGGVSGEISARMRDGTFSKYMVLPMNTQGYFLAHTAGAAGYYLIFDLLAAGLWMALFRVSWPVPRDAGLLLLTALMVVMGLSFMVQLNYLLGILVLKFENIGIFLMIKSNLALFLTGAMIPLALLPQGVQAACRVFPFYYVTYLPAMLVIGRFAEESARGAALQGVAVLSLWLAGVTALNTALYERLRVRYDGVGI